MGRENLDRKYLEGLAALHSTPISWSMSQVLSFPRSHSELLRHLRQFQQFQHRLASTLSTSGQSSPENSATYDLVSLARLLLYLMCKGEGGSETSSRLLPTCN
jgi:hypothetical protein